MSTFPHGGKGHQFRSVSIRKIENGWLSSTTAGDAHGVKSVERFHAKKPTLGPAAAGSGPAKTKAPAKAKAGRISGLITYRDPAQRPKRGV